jgi:hypothetical protein
MPENLLMFMRARLDEDEAAAKAVGYARIQTGEYLWGSKYLLLQDGKGGESKATTEFDGDLAEHIARHDPARALADVQAKRQIVDLMAGMLSAARGDSEVDHYGGLGAAEDTLSLLALPYADHPDYRQEWKP